MDSSPDTPNGKRSDAADLLALLGRTRARAADDPFGNPILSAALAISRRLDDGLLTEADLAAIIATVRDRSMLTRAERLRAYVGGTDPAVYDAVGSTVALAILEDVFPRDPGQGADHDYGEPSALTAHLSYESEHQTIFEPIARLFALPREISVALSHEIGAFG